MRGAAIARSTSIVALLDDANPTLVEKVMMWHQHYATTETSVEKVYLLLDGAEDAVLQIQAG